MSPFSVERFEVPVSARPALGALVKAHPGLASAQTPEDEPCIIFDSVEKYIWVVCVFLLRYT